MHVVRYTAIDQLAPLAARWDALARGVPFRQWAWLAPWWRTYGEESGIAGPKRALFVLAVRDLAGELVGLAPWYVQQTAAQGRVLRFLGGGEVCSDYLSILCRPDGEEAVAEALAAWLTEVPADPADGPGLESDRWDLLELSGVDAEDRAVARLADHLQARGNSVHRRPGPNCWRIALPSTWDAFLAALSKEHRKQLRRAERKLLATGRAALRTVERLEDLAAAQELLVALHQQRHTARGNAGCFASRRFCEFHRRAMPELLRSGALHLHSVELDGRPVAVEYQLGGGGVMYAYQAGVSPDHLEHSPGHLAHMITLRWAIEHGYRAFDFLRGDEPYKAHWRAAPRPGAEIRAIPARPSARLRHSLWLAGSRVRKWIKGRVGS